MKFNYYNDNKLSFSKSSIEKINLINLFLKLIVQQRPGWAHRRAERASSKYETDKH